MGGGGGAAGGYGQGRGRQGQPQGVPADTPFKETPEQFGNLTQKHLFLNTCKQTNFLNGPPNSLICFFRG